MNNGMSNGTSGLGLRLKIYRPATDAALGVVAANKAEITLLDRRINGIFPPNDGAPGFRLWVNFDDGGRPRRADDQLLVNDLEGAMFFLVPDGANPSSVVFSGAFAFAEDDRFRRLSSYPIPIHDRRESNGNGKY